MDSNKLTVIERQRGVAQVDEGLRMAGAMADHSAGAEAFTDYKRRKSANTVRRQRADLALFARFLDLAKTAVFEAMGGSAASAPTGDLSNDPTAWAGVTWGLVERFREWQLSEGYAVGSVNVRLSTVKVYATLAAKAGAIDAQGLALIKTVSGYRRAEGKRIDEGRGETRRVHAGGATVKKADAVLFSSVQAAQLKEQPTDTPRERRDRLLMTLLLEHGLRVSEAAILETRHFDLSAGTLTFYRPKVDKTETHELTRATLDAAKAYFKDDAPPIGPVFLASRSRGKSGTLNGTGMSIRAMRQRVKVLGQRVGIEGLSPHDLRHHAATAYAAKGYDVKRLMEIFGWASPAMAIRYVADSEIITVE